MKSLYPATAAMTVVVAVGAGLSVAAAGADASVEASRQIEQDWLRQEAVTWRRSADSAEALAGVLSRGRELIADMRRLGAATAAAAAARKLDAVEAARAALAHKPAGPGRWQELYLRARWAVRELALANPKLDFDQLLFVRRHWPNINHQCSHRVGEAQLPGANLCILTGLSPDGSVRELLGPAHGKGGIGRPDLSYDARRIVFPYAAPRAKPTQYGYGKPGVRGGACLMYDVYEIGVDGQGLRRLTASPDSEDTEPCYLPGGRIAFTSSRANRYVQCGDWALVCGIYTMAPDGSDVRRVTQPKEGEFYPSVLADGRIIYTRWDYVMKGYNVIQQLWAVYPDGTKAQLAYGDHYSFSRGPIAFQEARQIPGSTKVLCVGAAHHNTGVGPIMIVDLTQNRGGPAGMTCVTPEVGYPEAGASNINSPTGWYNSPYPLTDRHYLVTYSFEADNAARNGYGLYLQDVHGNKELIYRKRVFSCYSPIPLRPRRREPVIGDTVRGQADDAPATMVVTDVYKGLTGVRRGQAKHLRVLETYSKTVRTTPQRCDIGVSSGWDVRGVLGTVPIEADGSASFFAPPHKQLFFEVLDKDYLELRRMRNYTNAMPGEKVSCVGCHEPFDTAPGAGEGGAPLATRRPPSTIAPPPWGTGGLGFRRVVQPVLDSHCIRCHDGSEGDQKSFDLRGAEMVTAPSRHDGDQGPQHAVSTAFLNLLPYVEYITVGGYQGLKTPLPTHGTGSHKSKLMKLLGEGHYKVALDLPEWRALAAWIDCNAPFYGSWDEITLVHRPAPRRPRSPRPAAQTPAQKLAAKQRRAELAAAAPAGFRLACYLDCGPELTDAPKTGPTLTQATGSPYVYHPGDKPAHPRFATIAFDENAVTFDAARLDPKKTYRLGLSWWDYNSAGRVQSIVATSADGKVNRTLLARSPLPGWTGKKQLPATHDLAVPQAVTAAGRARLHIRRAAGANAVVSEVWLLESTGPAAAKPL